MSAMIHRRKSQASGTNRAAGNTLLEFLLAIAMFLVVAGGAFTLFGQSVPLFNQQQAAAGLNISLQNAVTEIQEDVVNAGTGYYTGANIPNWPIGVTIINQSDSVVCNVSATFTYTAGCFDTLNIITTDANTPPLHLGTTGACINTTSTSMIAQPPAGYTAAQIASLAGNFKSGDQLLLVKNDGSQMTTVKLTAGGSVSSGNILISINATNADGTNTATNDPLAITTHSNTTDNGGFSELGVQFCNADWVLRLQPTTYSVDLTNPNDPKLARTQNGVEAIVAEQIIGFRVELLCGMTLQTRIRRNIIIRRQLSARAMTSR